MVDHALIRLYVFRRIKNVTINSNNTSLPTFNNTNSYSYLDVLSSINSAIVFDSKANIEGFYGHLSKAFEFTRTNVEGLRGMFEGIEEKFKKSIMKWLRWWISNRSKANKWELTYGKLKRLAEFAPGEQLLSGDTFRDLLSTGNFTKPDEVGNLLDTFFGNQEGGAQHEETISIIKAWLNFAKRKHQANYWDKDPILNSIFFPAMCPNFCSNLDKDDCIELYGYIKEVNNIYIFQTFASKLLISFFTLTVKVQHRKFVFWQDNRVNNNKIHFFHLYYTQKHP